MTEQEISALALRLRALSAGLGIDDAATRRIVEAVDAEANASGRWPSEEERFLEVRRRMIAEAGQDRPKRARSTWW